MRKLLLFALGILSFFSLFASTVDEQKALAIATKFSQLTFPQSNLKFGSTLTLVYQCISQEKTNLKSTKANSYFYVFNSSDKGFIITSGDDAVYPILGYSTTNAFEPDKIPKNVAKWLESYKAQIRYVIAHNLQPTASITDAWNGFLGNQSKLKSVQSVLPLVKTQWSQSPYYNSLCPSSSVTGCVATAMAQLMKYWNYPVTGSGFHSYNHSTYGTLSANFGSTTYNWVSMPNSVTSSNSAVATLMYQCGVSVDMDYSPESSGAYVISSQSPVTNCSEYAFKTYFGYKNTLKGIQRSGYTETQWLNLLKAEFDASRPVIYAGFGGGGGHCFIADGYDNNNYVHFNWGWGGAYDGYFTINALNPSGTGTGGGTGGYNSGHQAVIGIEPPTGVLVTDLGLYNYVTPSTSSIYYGQSFTVSANITNNGTNTFTGDFCAAIFDNTQTFIDYVETKTGNTLQAGYHYVNDIVFSSTGLLSMLPGTYTIGIFYRPIAGNWVQVSNSGVYTNMVSFSVVNPNNMALNSVMSITPGTALTQGQSASVNLNIRNDGSSTFIGSYGVGLYNLDGTAAQTIDTYSETAGLDAGYTYLSPFLTFSTPIVTVSPGTYLLAVMHNPNNAGWELTGSNYYQNPVKVTVVLPNLLADAYETNNTAVQSFTLPVSFVGNAASINSQGSNFHINADVDYYKTTLNSGYNYTITARLHDSYNSGNSISYSADALFSYSTDGTNWSDVYDDVMPGTFLINGGGTVYFKVSPYFAGVTGTYLLDLQVSRTTSVGFEEIEIKNLVSVYLNPASETLIIDLNNFNGEVQKIQLINSIGQVVRAFDAELKEKSITISLSGLKNGVYIVQILTNNGTINKKISVKN